MQLQAQARRTSGCLYAYNFLPLMHFIANKRILQTLCLCKTLYSGEKLIKTKFGAFFLCKRHESSALIFIIFYYELRNSWYWWNLFPREKNLQDRHLNFFRHICAKETNILYFFFIFHYNPASILFFLFIINLAKLCYLTIFVDYLHICAQVLCQLVS